MGRRTSSVKTLIGSWSSGGVASGEGGGLGRVTCAGKRGAAIRINAEKMKSRNKRREAMCVPSTDKRNDLTFGKRFDAGRASGELPAGDFIINRVCAPAPARL